MSNPIEVTISAEVPDKKVTESIKLVRTLRPDGAWNYHVDMSEAGNWAMPELGEATAHIASLVHAIKQAEQTKRAALREYQNADQDLEKAKAALFSLEV